MYGNARGLVSNLNPHALPAGAMVAQNNCGGFLPGTITGRRGMIPLPFSGFSPSVSDDVIAIYKLDIPSARYLVYERSSGVIQGVYDGGSQTVYNALNPFQMISATRDRRGNLLMVNGVDRGLRWNGTSAAADLLGIDPPANGPTIVVNGSGGNLTAGSYICNYRYVDAENIPSSVSVDTTVDVGGSDSLTWKDFVQSSQSRVTAVQLFRTTAGESDTLYLVTTLGIGGTVTSSANSGGSVVFTMAQNHNLAIGAKFTVAGHSVSGYNTAHTVVSFTATTVTTSTGYTSSGSGGTWTISEYTDQISDADLVLPYQSGAASSVASNGGKVQVTTADTHNLIIGTIVSLSGQSPASVNGSYTVASIESATVFTTTATWASNATGGFWAVTGYSGAAANNGQLDASGSRDLPYFNDNGTLNARRFVPPPDHRAFAAIFQDRLWLYGSVVYNKGTIAISGTTATGTNTAWTPQMVGRFIYVAGVTSPLLITGYTSATSLTLGTAATVTAGTSYAIRPDPALQRALYFSEQDEYEAMPAINYLPIQENLVDHDDETGLMVYNSLLWLLHERHIYMATFVQQPDIDTNVNLVASRGALNFRCAVVAEDQAYMLDMLGVWRLTGMSVNEEMGQQIQDLFRDNVLDFSQYTQYWFGEYEPNERVVRFFVRYAGDSGTYPTRAICKAFDSNEWWTETYPWGITCGCRINYGGARNRLMLGSTADHIYMASEGLCDGIATGLQGSVTSAGSTTLTDSSASFTSAVVGATVAITAGTGKGQLRVISARTSTQLTVPAWSTTPDSTSQYAVGAIPLSFRTGPFDYGGKPTQTADQAGKRSRIGHFRLTFKPPANAMTLDFRRYLDHNTAPDNYSMAFSNMGVTCTPASPNAVIDLYQNGNSSGLRITSIYHQYDDTSLSNRWIAAEVQGYQCLDRVQIYDLSLAGLES